MTQNTVRAVSRMKAAQKLYRRLKERWAKAIHNENKTVTELYIGKMVSID
jgi:hypothetical protein